MKKNKTRIRKTVIKWQTAGYQGTQTIKLEFPLQFLMICKLVDTPPEKLIIEFIDNLSSGSWKREGREKARQLLSEYFIELGYGKDAYSPDQLRNMFAELDAMALVFPKDGDVEQLEAYSTWRQNHQQYWFNKWNNR
ncbi:MAG TPA: hypothetical protein VM101_01155 [Flavitalea sp.]|nr:hypothetical protein [Flavitalea sp.]